jgi:hypothetical protein
VVTFLKWIPFYCLISLDDREEANCSSLAYNYRIGFASPLEIGFHRGEFLARMIRIFSQIASIFLSFSATDEVEQD